MSLGYGRRYNERLNVSSTQREPIFNAPDAVKWIAGATFLAHLGRIYLLPGDASISTCTARIEEKSDNAGARPRVCQAGTLTSSRTPQMERAGYVPPLCSFFSPTACGRRTTHQAESDESHGRVKKSMYKETVEQEFDPA